MFLMRIQFGRLRTGLSPGWIRLSDLSANRCPIERPCAIAFVQCGDVSPDMMKCENETLEYD